ncbi:hypothetical protein E1J38_006170 [Seonamhaeicola sediminis]|uniref:Secreted protein n=1 Tax=Seonamhaeicola sediminis TaxID=2528206 RepID=A0A562YGL2_9FLAO|nr:hypothetical protein [Seonamhaeicola sediminis]TWO33515.1 hypothetical protein E1J38_006170 [Seonamhaeicola sediminis]
MKKLLHKSFSVFLASLVLFSTLSFTIEKHFCGDVLVDVAVFTQVEKCGMESEDMGLSEITKKPCCKDEINIVEGQDELLKTFNELDFEQQQFITSFIYSYINLFEGQPKKIVPHKDYSPPNLVRDILVLDQVFLI